MGVDWRGPGVVSLLPGGGTCSVHYGGGGGPTELHIANARWQGEENLC